MVEIKRLSLAFVLLCDIIRRFSVYLDALKEKSKHEQTQQLISDLKWTIIFSLFSKEQFIHSFTTKMKKYKLQINLYTTFKFLSIVK